MICPPCRRAGRLNAVVRLVTDEEAAAYLRLRAIEAHGECDGRCDCKHQTEA